MSRLAAAVIGCLLSLVACGDDNKLTSGRVVDKRYEAPYSYTTTNCASYGSNGACNVWIPQTHFVPESFELRIEGYDTDEKKHVEWHEVSEATYEDHAVGDRWDARS